MKQAQSETGPLSLVGPRLASRFCCATRLSHPTNRSVGEEVRFTERPTFIGGDLPGCS